MDVLIYAAEKIRVLEWLQGRIEQLIKGNRCVRVFHDLQVLARERQYPQRCVNEGLAVFLLTERAELENVVSMAHLLRNMRNILVLPDREQVTLIRAHKLLPRFITFLDDDLSNLVAVLERMINRGFQAAGDCMPRAGRLTV